MVEMSLVLPLLLLILMGVADFGRVFYTAIEVTNAANAGALAGSRNVPSASKTDLMSQAAKNDASDLSGLTVTSQKYCKCSNGSSVACSGTCATGSVRMYVSVTAQKTFSTLATYPKVPSQTPISRTTVIR